MNHFSKGGVYDTRKTGQACADQRTDMWLHWKAGEWLHEIGRAFGKVKAYFCDPQSPWQRGTNEDTNRLLRQYFPTKTDLSGYSQSDLDKMPSEFLTPTTLSSDQTKLR
jgi:hypothetical protein